MNHIEKIPPNSGDKSKNWVFITYPNCGAQVQGAKMGPEREIWDADAEIKN